MTRVHRLILSLTLPALVTYGLASFVVWDFNPAAWSEMQRLAFVFMSSFCTLIFVLVTFDFGRGA
jgi:hypothetical protein